jgi:hypothetical protein
MPDEPVSPSEKFARFMGGFAAAAQLCKRAQDRSHHMEYIILAASLVDGLLRMGLLLQHQIETSSVELLEELLYQATDDKIIPEREIYRRAFGAGVVDQALFDELNDLYNWRNRVVHRYIISEITTADVQDVASDYHRALSRATFAVEQIEKRQIILGVGMTTVGRRSPSDNLNEWAKLKHGESSRIIRPDWLDKYR